MSAQPIVISMPSAIQLKRILFATDFSPASERALPIVSAIARHYDSQIFLAHVWTPKPYPLPEAPVVSSGAEEIEARKLMTDLLCHPELEKLRTSVTLESGGPVERIAKYVRSHGIDLVILGTHGRTGLSHAFMGSVAEELFRTLNCAVLTVGPNLDTRFTGAKTIKNILFPTDLSPESKAVFPYVASLAKEFGSEIAFLHILLGKSRANPDSDKLAQLVRDEMQQMFSPHLGPKCKPQYIVEFGDVVPCVLCAARDYQSDLIGLGVKEGNELVTHFRSTAAYRVVAGAPCPVLTVRGTL